MKNRKIRININRKKAIILGSNTVTKIDPKTKLLPQAMTHPNRIKYVDHILFMRCTIHSFRLNEFEKRKK